MSEIRRHFVAMFAPVLTMLRNSFVPSMVRLACCSKKSKKLVSRGRKRPNTTRSCNTCAVIASRERREFEARRAQPIDERRAHRDRRREHAAVRRQRIAREAQRRLAE